MRSPLAILVIAAVALAACDNSISPTAPRTLPPEEANVFLFLPQWTVVRLPFRPYAINDAGVIVGTLNGEAVRWETGTMNVLPHAPGMPLDRHIAVGITPLGKIIGRTGNYTLVWPTPTQAPHMFQAPVSDAELHPEAMNDVGAFVAQTLGNSVLSGHAWRYTPTSGLRDITVAVAGGQWNVVVGINAAGYVAATARGTGHSTRSVGTPPGRQRYSLRSAARHPPRRSTREATYLAGPRSARRSGGPTAPSAQLLNSPAGRTSVVGTTPAASRGTRMVRDAHSRSITAP